MLHSLLDKQKQDNAAQVQREQSGSWTPEKLESMRVAFEAAHNSRPGIYELWPDELLRQHTLTLMEQKRREAESASAEYIVQDEREWEELKRGLNAARADNQEIPPVSR